MAGRYTDWTHIRVPAGADRDAAAPYVPFARKLLGMVSEQAVAGNLAQHSMRKELPDGAVVIAELRNAIPRITIVPPPPRPQPPDVLEADDFVVWARDLEHPAGIDPEFPQQILKPSWRTFFYAASTDGHDELAGKKGVYGGLFPEGLRRAGNVDWRSPQGVRVSWYGPSTRYFYDVFRQPRQQYGKWVFELGRPLLDVDAYIAASEEEEPFAARWIMGAALRGLDLYVVHAELPALATDMSPIANGVLYFGESLPLAPIPVVLSRFRLLVDASGPVRRHSVVLNSRTQLWADELAQAVNPWIFSPDCGRAITYTPSPLNTAISFGADSATGFESPPGETDQRLELELDGDAATLSSTPITLDGAAHAAIATDWTDKGVRVDVTLTRALVEDTEGAPLLHFAGGPGTPLTYRTNNGAPFDNTYLRRNIAFLDARESVAVFQQRTMIGVNNTLVGGSIGIELWRGGALVADLVSPGPNVNAGIASNMDRFLNPTGDARQGIDVWRRASLYPVAPSYVLYGQLAYVNFVLRGTGFTGLHSVYVANGEDPAHVYGGYGPGPRTSPILVSGSTIDTFASDRVDFDGRRSWIGVAAYRGKTVLSALPGRDTADSLHYATGGQLPTLTGVEGASARYHPVWLLGKPPAA